MKGVHSPALLACGGQLSAVILPKTLPRDRQMKLRIRAFIPTPALSPLLLLPLSQDVTCLAG